MSNHHSLIIVGSGPAGYTSAIYAARAGLEPLVIAGSVTAGGALMNTTEVENFPGFVEGIQGPELMETLQSQAQRFGAVVSFDDATELQLDAQPKVIKTALGEEYTADAVILAMGSAYRELGLPAEKALSGKGVSWCATCDGFFYRDQDVVVVGGGDSAMEEATFLTRFAKSVTVVHRRDELRASKIMAERALANEKITFAWNSEVAGLEGTAQLEGVRLRNLVDGTESVIPATGLFVAIGHVPRSELVVGQVPTDEAGYVLVEGRTTATTIPGVFAAGDLVDSRYRQAITAAGSGCAAALDAQHFLDNLADASAVSAPETPKETTVVSTPVSASTDTFEAEVLKSDVPVVVDFWAPWCGPCRAVAPILDELAGEYAGKLKIVKVNTDENPDLARAYGIVSIPTMNFFKGGELVKSITGARPKPSLSTLFDEVIAE